MKKILLIGHTYHLSRHVKGFYDSLSKRFDLQILFVDDIWPTSIKEVNEYDKYEACIWYVRFRELMTKPAFDWADFRGLRIMYEEDAHLNYHHLVGNSHYFGKWPDVYKKNELHMMICTGKQTRDALQADGVNAYWLPKAYDPSQIFDKKMARKGLCHYGQLYPSRKAMLHYLQRKKIEYQVFQSPYEELNNELNKYVGCLICNMSGNIKTGAWKIVNHFYPSRGIDLDSGFEPMLKNFESAGAGCVPIADWIEELEELGFVDGQTMISYRSFQELAEKLFYYQKNPDLFHEIRNRACSLAKARHTWDNRAAELEEILNSTKYN